MVNDHRPEALPFSGTMRVMREHSQVTVYETHFNFTYNLF